MSTRVDVEDVVRLVDEGAQTIDVSSPDDFTTGHLPGAVSIPIAALRRNQVDDLDRSAPVLVYAQSCDSDASTRAAALLERFGFAQVRVFIMGLAQWAAHGLTMEGRGPYGGTVNDRIVEDVTTRAPDLAIGRARTVLDHLGRTGCLVVDGDEVVLGYFDRGVAEDDPEPPLSVVMVDVGPTVRPNATDAEASELFRQSGAGHLIVTKPTGVLVGLVRRHDVALQPNR